MFWVRRLKLPPRNSVIRAGSLWMRGRTQSDHGDEGRRRGAQLHRTLLPLDRQCCGQRSTRASITSTSVTTLPLSSMLAMHDAAQAAGVTALIRNGELAGHRRRDRPALHRTTARRVRSVDIMRARGRARRPQSHQAPPARDGPRYHCSSMATSSSASTRGRWSGVRAQFDFRDVGQLPVYPTRTRRPSPCPYCRAFRNVRRTWGDLPLAYFHRTQQLVPGGPVPQEPLTVGDGSRATGCCCGPSAESAAGLLEEAQVTGPAGCLAVEVGGIRMGTITRYVFQLSSTMAGASEGTGIPAAVGTILMHRGISPVLASCHRKPRVDPTSFPSRLRPHAPLGHASRWRQWRPACGTHWSDRVAETGLPRRLKPSTSRPPDWPAPPPPHSVEPDVNWALSGPSHQSQAASRRYRPARSRRPASYLPIAA